MFRWDVPLGCWVGVLGCRVGLKRIRYSDSDVTLGQISGMIIAFQIVGMILAFQNVLV